MCGIAGVIHKSGRLEDHGLLRRMGGALVHRGPDAHGAFVDGPCGLVHQRLAILDLSPLGAQPMSSQNGRFHIIFNGEIYNYKALRAACEREGVHFRSTSDTEVLLEGFALWGAPFVNQLNGMFAFAVWDRHAQELFIARDRYGIKPLYLIQTANFFAFASEIKALLLLPDIHRAPNYEAISQYLSFQNVFDDQTFFKRVTLLEPASMVTVSSKGGTKFERYWDFKDWWREDITDAEVAEQEVRGALQQAVKRQLQSDVPVGSFLSGGVDSGAIVAFASQGLSRLDTFTCGFDLDGASGSETEVDERLQAREVSRLFKTEHHELIVRARDIEAVMPQLSYHIEDPRLAPCYPNWFAAKLASGFVKVVLSGTGGDEFFGGYPWRYMSGFSQGKNFAEMIETSFDFWQRVLRRDEKREIFTDSVASTVAELDGREHFMRVMREWDREVKSDEDAISLSLYFELKTFLRGILLVEDKVSMAHGLETRVPFLDDELVKVALRLSPHLKLRPLGNESRVERGVPAKKMLLPEQNTNGKYILRKALSSSAPPEVFARAKQGFVGPDASWFKGESTPYINQLLRNKSARIYEIVNRNVVERILDQHCSGAANRKQAIWSFLSLEHWLQTFFPN